MNEESIKKIYDEIEQMEVDLDFSKGMLLKHYTDPYLYAGAAHSTLDKTLRRISGICYEQKVSFTYQPKYIAEALDRCAAKVKQAMEAYKAQEEANNPYWEEVH